MDLTTMLQSGTEQSKKRRAMDLQYVYLDFQCQVSSPLHCECASLLGNKAWGGDCEVYNFVAHKPSSKAVSGFVAYLLVIYTHT